MSVFIIPDVQPLNKVSLDTGIFLVILNVDKKPPHIALLINSKIYSLTVKGRQMGESADTLMKSIHIRSIKTLFFALKPPMADALKAMEKSLMAYEKAIAGKATCLSPLKDFFTLAYPINAQKANYIFELLPLLYRNQKITGVYHLNMENEMKEKNYHFQTYTMDEINANIIKLNQSSIK